MSSPLVLIAGTNRLSAAIEERLRGAGATIGRISEEPAALTAAALEGAAALVIAAHDDAGNVDMALTTRRLRPELPLVIRLFDPTLTAYVRSTLPGAEILSMSSVAAPVLADGPCARSRAARWAAPAATAGSGVHGGARSRSGSGWTGSWWARS